MDDLEWASYYNLIYDNQHTSNIDVLIIDHHLIIDFKPDTTCHDIDISV